MADERKHNARMGARDNGGRQVRIAIIGAGPGGLCMGKRLLDEGFDDFVLLEKTDGVGGTWHLNRYPGCECDIQSALYSFSFEVKPDWSKPYGTQPEILEYMRGVAEKYGLLPHCRLGNGVARAVWDEATAGWTLTLESGDTVEADVVVSAIGMFNDLSWPDIDGLDSFRGTTFHSARWDWDHDLTGERVAVIGSAASAVQFVPEIVKTAGQVHLFQRTANWVLPKLDAPYTPEQIQAFRADPAPVLAFRAEIVSTVNQGMTFADQAVNAEREAIGLAAIDVVKDPEVRRKLRPTHPFGCKRPLMSNVYYAAFNEPNLELVTDPIARITENAVVTDDGVVARSRHDRHRDRLRGDEVPLGHRRRRARRASPRRRVGRRRAGLPRHHDVGLPEPVHALRAEHEQRLDPHDDRGPGRARPLPT